MLDFSYSSKYMGKTSCYSFPSKYVCDYPGPGESYAWNTAMDDKMEQAGKPGEHYVNDKDDEHLLGLFGEPVMNYDLPLI